ncbi:MAG TPA: PGPGW domain-containing protein [Actinomycetota bacterium]|nr:PGPGW domain-containing protein [Actinomycetota bacterium]
MAGKDTGRKWVRFPLRAVARFIARSGKRIAVTLAGFALILVGLFLSLPGIPGPGVLVMIGGLAVLATEYVWAERMLNVIKAKAEQAKQKAIEKRDQRRERKAAKRAAKG